MRQRVLQKYSVINLRVHTYVFSKQILYEILQNKLEYLELRYLLHSYVYIYKQNNTQLLSNNP